MQLIQILTNTIEQANSVLDELKSGESFETLYEKYQKIYPDSGDVSNREIKFDQFEAAIADLNVGDYSDPINTVFGFHIVYRTS